MALNVMVWVLEHSETTLGKRLVLLTLAEYAHDDGRRAYPAVETIARKSRLSRRAVQTALRQLEEDGAIKHTGSLKDGRHVYSVSMGAQNMRGAQSATRRGEAASPNPLKDPSVEEGARPGERVKIGGKAVKVEAWRLTGKVLAEFNSQAGRKLRLLSSSGQPSEAAKRIYGRIAAYPDISLAEHADIIQRTLASKWWGDGPPSIGVVYGPRVFEENITREGKPRSKTAAKDEGRKARNARRRQLFIDDQEEMQRDAA